VDILKEFLEDERGETSMIIKLLLAVTLFAAVIMILLQFMRINSGTIKGSTANISLGAKSGLEDTMRTLSD
jgi:hypothetical protein